MTQCLLRKLFVSLILSSPRRTWEYYPFCGVEVLPTSCGLLLSQRKYVIDLLTKHNMLTSKTVPTPLAVGSPLSAHDGSPPVDVTLYRQFVGGLQHLCMTRPDIAFAVNKLS